MTDTNFISLWKMNVLAKKVGIFKILNSVHYRDNFSSRKLCATYVGL